MCPPSSQSTSLGSLSSPYLLSWNLQNTFFNYACHSVRLVENYKDFRKTINVQEADTTKDRDNKYLLNAVEDLICIPYFIFLKAVLKNNI